MSRAFSRVYPYDVAQLPRLYSCRGAHGQGIAQGELLKGVHLGPWLGFTGKR